MELTRKSIGLWVGLCTDCAISRRPERVRGSNLVQEGGNAKKKRMETLYSTCGENFEWDSDKHSFFLVFFAVMLERFGDFSATGRI
jgi:hypothetical protein